MDYQKFIQQLPLVYENWGEDKMCPKAEQFIIIEQQINKGINANLMALINLAVDSLETDEIYCQLGGIAEGKSLIGALWNNPEREGYAVEINENEQEEDQMTDLINNLVGSGLEEQVSYSSYSSVEEFFLDLKKVELESQIGVYFYNFKSDYRSQLLSLLFVKDFLAERALIIVNNSNYGMVQQACFDFLASHPQSKLLLDLSTSSSEDYTFGNGVYVIAWNQHQEQNYDYHTLITELTNKSAIQSISELHNNYEFSQKPQALKVLLNQANDLKLQGQIEKAVQKYQKTLEWEKYNSDVYYELGIIYEQLEKFEEAISLIIKAVNLNFKKAKYHYSIGVLFSKLGNPNLAIKAYEKAIEIEPNLSYVYNNLGNIFYVQKNWEKAISVYKKGLKVSAKNERIYRHLISSLQSVHEIEEAISKAEEALKIFPNSLLLKIENQKILPLIYETRKEIDIYRERFTQYLDELISLIKLESVEQKNQALEGIRVNTYFGLHYQGKDDLSITIKLGNLIYKIMAANYSSWTKVLEMYQLAEGEKIRIAYLSAWFRNNNSANWSLDWIKNTNREEFEIYCYYTDKIQDEMTEKFYQESDYFYQVPQNIEAICQQIVSDKIHILIYPDIGTIPLTTQIAALRLAPIQCAAWGSPVTSGLPTIDYYLSSDLMEPENAQKHYSEELVRLPNLGLCYPKPKIPKILKDRKYFNLDETSIIYLCCQNLFKYLPQYDYIFPIIATQVAQAKFVFIESQISENVTQKFKKRLQTAFDNLNLNSEQYCVILPQLTQEDYIHINLVSDIYLDTFDWSGANTTMQAIACNLPIVTCPGEFMRGRHSYAMLKMLGIEETIAKDESEYIEIAVRLGLDKQWRNSIVEKTKTNEDKVYNDITCVRALENFFRQAVRQASKTNY